MGSEKRVALFGLLGVGNLGNDGSLEAVVQSLRRVAPHDALICICSNPDVITTRYGLKTTAISHDPSWAISAWPLGAKILGKLALPVRLFRELRRVKALIVPGMGVLDDFTVTPLGWPLDIFLWLTAARLMGVKVALVSIGAGPIENRLSRALMGWAARAAHFRSFRDAFSKEYVAGLGVDVTKDPIVPDVAFGLSKPVTADGGSGLTVGVGLMTYQGWHESAESAAIYSEYRATMVQFIEWLLERGSQVRLLIGSKSDEQAVHDVLGALSAEAAHAVIYRSANDLGEVLKQVAEVDLVVATRYHNVVCALTLGKPTISIEYSRKNAALLGEMGLAEYCQQIESLDLSLLKMQFDRLLDERGHLEEAIRQKVDEFQQRLSDQELRLAAFLSA